MNAADTHMIAQDVSTCTGCAACAAACPVDAISMCPDIEGFLYPQTNAAVCTDCGICRKTCPANRTNSPEEAQGEGSKKEKPLSVFAAWHLDEAIRRESSSGGVFTALAESFLAQGGFVAGAAYDDNLVVRHTLVETAADLQRLRGSKYVQSEISITLYHQVRDHLKQGRPVFFSGTPCQIAGLQSFLGKAHATLFCCDIACHGVPSPFLFARYVQENQVQGEKLANVSFRDKTTGWKRFGVRRHLQNGASTFIAMAADPYMLAFLRDYALRPSCYTCRFANTTRPGDLTLADFWGVAKQYPEYDCDDKGTSLVLVNTEKGKTWLNTCRQSLFLGHADLDTAIAGNRVLVRPHHRPPERDTFYHNLGALSFPALIKKYRLHPPSWIGQRLGTIKKMAKVILPTDTKNYINSKALDVTYRIASQRARSTSDGTNANAILILPAADGWKGPGGYGFGDEMLMLGLLAGLRKKYDNIGTLSLNSQGVYDVSIHGNRVKQLGFSKGWLSPASYKEFLEIASCYSHFVVIGADVLDGAYGALNSIQRLRFLCLAEAMGLKTAVSGCSFNGTNDTRIRNLFVKAENSGAIIHARDKMSLDRFSAFLKKTKSVADLAFLVDAEKYPIQPRVETIRTLASNWRENAGVVVGLNFCGWHINDKERFFEEFIAAIAQLNDSSHPLALLLLPHDTRKDRWSDLDTLEEFRRRLGRRISIIGSPEDIQSGIDAKQAVGCCDVLLTGRMHLAIAAHDQGVPAVSFGYQGKFEGFYDLFDMGPEWLVDYGDPITAGHTLKLIIEQRQGLSLKIKERKQATHLAASRNFDWLDKPVLMK